MQQSKGKKEREEIIRCKGKIRTETGSLEEKKIALKSGAIGKCIIKKVIRTQHL